MILSHALNCPYHSCLLILLCIQHWMLLHLPPWSSSPTLISLSTNPSTSQPTITTKPTSPSVSLHPTAVQVSPSHSLEPIVISHYIKWIIFIHNKDGHVSELRCFLPIRTLDGALLEESRGFMMRFRRLLHRTSELGSILSWSGGEGSDDDEGNEEWE